MVLESTLCCRFPRHIHADVPLEKGQAPVREASKKQKRSFSGHFQFFLYSSVFPGPNPGGSLSSLTGLRGEYHMFSVDAMLRDSLQEVVC